jgi:hypothetical protein
MTAEKKAHELVRAFGYEIGKELPNGGYKFNIDKAKKLALIAIDEIIKAIPDASFDDSPYNHELVWWQEVKQEIEKL